MNYNDTLVNTHTALNQVLGLTTMRKFSKSTMSTCLRILKYGNVLIYDFPKYLEININEGLTTLKKGESMDFRWYSLLMYMILFHKKKYFAQCMDMSLKGDEVFLVQLWATILSMDWEGSSFVLFVN